MKANPTLTRAAVALCATAAFASPAAAAGGGTKFKGKNEQNRTLSYKVKGGKVRDFVGGVNMFCIGEGIEFNAVIPPGPMKITGGKFSYKGRDKSDSTNIELSGTIKGGKAKGKMSMTDSRYDAYNQTFTSCSGSAKWTAKAK